MPRNYKEVRADEVYRIRKTDTVGTYWMIVCSECGMPVAQQFTEAHDEWHESFQELKDKVWRAGLE